MVAKKLKSISNFDQSPVQPIARFELRDLSEIREFADASSPEERTVYYVLEGPDSPWRNIFERDIRDPVGIVYEDAPLDLDVRFQCFISKDPTQDTKPDDPSTGLQRQLLTLGVTTEQPRSQLSDEEFLSSADQLVDDILLLISFGMKQWTVRYRSVLRAEDRVQKRVRRVKRTVRDREPGDNMVPVPPEDMLAFLQTSLPSLREYREADKSMTTAIQTALSGLHEDYVESQFLSVFTSLEVLKNIYASEEEREFTLGREKFKKLHSDLKEVVQDRLPGDENKEKRCELYQSLLGVNRRSLRTLLEGMFEKCETGWGDLYPAGESASLINTRNNLVHGGDISSPSSIAGEFERLQAVIERLILRMLGWKDTSQSPPEIKRERLTSPTS